jgi:hypothetical protein
VILNVEHMHQTFPDQLALENLAYRHRLHERGAAAVKALHTLP